MLEKVLGVDTIIHWLLFHSFTLMFSRFIDQIRDLLFFYQIPHNHMGKDTSICVCHNDGREPFTI